MAAGTNDQQPLAMQNRAMLKYAVRRGSTTAFNSRVSAPRLHEETAKSIVERPGSSGCRDRQERACGRCYARNDDLDRLVSRWDSRGNANIQLRDDGIRSGANIQNVARIERHGSEFHGDGTRHPGYAAGSYAWSCGWIGGTEARSEDRHQIARMRRGEARAKLHRPHIGACGRVDGRSRILSIRVMRKIQEFRSSGFHDCRLR